MGGPLDSARLGSVAMVEKAGRPYVTRLVEPSELLECFTLGEHFLAETKQPCSIILNVAVQSWTTYLVGGVGMIVGLRSDRLLGALGAFCYRDLYDGVLLAQEAFWYVMPEARRGGIALLLLDAFEEWGRTIGAGRFVVSSFEGICPGLELIYRRRGYVFPANKLFMKNG